jgi:hypothetical protein
MAKAPERYLVIPVEAVRVAYGADEMAGRVLVELDLPTDVTGMFPGVGLMMDLSPAQARALARTLDKKAGEAEGKPPPPSTSPPSSPTRQ